MEIEGKSNSIGGVPKRSSRIHFVDLGDGVIEDNNQGLGILEKATNELASGFASKGDDVAVRLLQVRLLIAACCQPSSCLLPHYYK